MKIYVEQAEIRAQERYETRVTMIFIICALTVCAFAFWYAYTAEMKAQAESQQSHNALLSMQDSPHRIVKP